jgi:hypothetical protein
MGGLTFGWQDYSIERSSTNVRWMDLTAGNIAAELIKIQALFDALEGVTMSPISREVIKAEDNQFSVGSPTVDSQREKKWLVKGTDTVLNRAVTIEVPTADLAFLAASSDTIDLTSAEWLALKAALDAGWLSAAGNPVVANTAIFVGRRT